MSLGSQPTGLPLNFVWELSEFGVASSGASGPVPLIVQSGDGLREEVPTDRSGGTNSEDEIAQHELGPRQLRPVCWISIRIVARAGAANP